MDHATQHHIGEQLAQAFLYGIVFAVVAALWTRSTVDLLASAYWSWRSSRRVLARRRRAALSGAGE